MKILVRNLARTTTEDAVRTLFAGFGHVAAVTIVMDQATGQSKGFGFVEMPNPKQAVTAVKRSNLTRFEGSVIRVKLSEDKPTDTDTVTDA
ncbi:MAG: RNA-binding protein [Pseudomonadota bacterium]|nr:RNA-binding protein [Pseudomonadota bacterium]